MKAVIYARFSCSKQREASIDDQLRVCREWCERERYDVVNVYTDYAMSGRTDERPAFQKMISAAGESDVVVVYMMDRFSRDPYDAPIYKRELAKHGVRVVSAMENVPDTPEGMLLDKLLEGMAAMESMKNSARTKRGMEGNALKCMANGVHLYGYDIGSDGLYHINEDQAVFVREAYSRRLCGEAPASIARYLASMGVVTYAGNPCSPTMVEHMLRSEKYCGVYKFGDIRIEGGMPAIVKRETWLAVQSAPRAKRRKSEEFREYPLAGRSVCMCGANLAGHSAHGHGGRYDYYVCGKRCGQVKAVRADALELAIVNAIRGILIDRSEALRIAHMVASSVDNTEMQSKLKTAQEAAKAAQTALDNMMNAVKAGLVHPDMQREINEAVARRDAALAEAANISDVEEFDVEDFADFLQFGATLDDAAVLKAFVGQVLLFDGYAVVTMNYKDKKSEPATITVDGFAEFCMAPHRWFNANRWFALKGKLFLAIKLAA